MKPKGLVAAASMTSQMSMPMRRPSMLELVHQGDIHAAEDVFQQLGHLRGPRGADRHDRDRPARRAPRAARPLGGLMPPTTLGICARPNCLLPGSSRSGEKARKKSVGIFSASGPRAIGAQAALFEDREHQFSGGARDRWSIRARSAGPSAGGLDGAGGLLDVAEEIGLAALVERRGHAE